MKFLKEIKEKLKNPKTRSLTLLGIYAVFFIFVFALIRSGESISVVEEDNIIDVEDKKLSYSYKYTIYDNEDIIEVSGVHYDNVDKFFYNDVEYEKIGKYFYSNDEMVDLDIDYYGYDILESLIGNSDSMTKYKDDDTVLYSINSSKYFDLFDKQLDCEIDDCLSDILLRVDKGEYINNVEIDLSNYFKYNYSVVIEYSNFEFK